MAKYVTSIAGVVEVPSYGLVITPEAPVELPGVEEITKVLGLEKPATEAQVREVHEQILANPMLRVSEEQPKKKEKTEEQPSGNDNSAKPSK